MCIYICSIPAAHGFRVAHSQSSPALGVPRYPLCIDESCRINFTHTYTHMHTHKFMQVYTHIHDTSILTRLSFEIRE